jgi:hypothetical protein
MRISKTHVNSEATADGSSTDYTLTNHTNSIILLAETTAERRHHDLLGDHPFLRQELNKGSLDH